MNRWLFKSSTSSWVHVAEPRLPGQGKRTEHCHLGPPKGVMSTELTQYSNGSSGGTGNAWSRVAGGKEPASPPPPQAAEQGQTAAAALHQLFDVQAL